MFEKELLAELEEVGRRYEEELRRILERMPEAQIERLKKVRRERDNDKVEKAKKRLLDACKGNENIMPPMIEAVKCYMTAGECGQIMADAEGYSSILELINVNVSQHLLL